MALNYLLITILAYFAALAANDIIIPRSGPEGSFSSAVSRSAERLPTHSRSDYQAIVERDIFNLTPPPVVAPPPVVEDLHLTLIGVSRMSKGKPFAIIQDQEGQQAVYRVGETIPDSGKLVAVEGNRAIIEHDGRRISVELPKDQLAGPPGLRRLGIAGQPDDSDQASEPDPDTSIDSSSDVSAEPSEDPPEDSN
jgi:type II secretory pathway component PulC